MLRARMNPSHSTPPPASRAANATAIGAAAEPSDETTRPVQKLRNCRWRRTTAASLMLFTVRRALFAVRVVGHRVCQHPWSPARRHPWPCPAKSGAVNGCGSERFVHFRSPIKGHVDVELAKSCTRIYGRATCSRRFAPGNGMNPVQASPQASVSSPTRGVGRPPQPKAFMFPRVHVW